MQVGIPVGNLSYANAQTLPGYAAAVSAGNRARGARLLAANTAFQRYLGTQTFSPKRFRFQRDLTGVYKAGLQGLGDDATDTSDTGVNLDFLSDPTDTQTQLLLAQIDNGTYGTSDSSPISPPATSSDSDWTGILKAISAPLASGVGLGIGGKIAGVNPFAKPIINPLTSAPMSTTTKLLLVGGAVVLGAFAIAKMGKKTKTA